MTTSHDFSTINDDACALQTLDANDLSTCVGGDFWGGYTSKLSSDWKDVTYRLDEAKKYNGVNGNTDNGKFVYNFAGAAADAGKTVWDASLGQAGKAIGKFFK
jgi:hypothetical protein